MPLSKEATDCIEAVKQSDFKNDDRCTYVQSELLGLLSVQEKWISGTVFTPKEMLVGDGIYGLRIHPVNSEVLWQHGVTIVRAGGTPCVYQAWVGSYTLSQWLGVLPPSSCNSICFHKYSPCSKFFDEDPEENVVSWISFLAPLKHTYDAADFEDFKAETTKAFSMVVFKYFGVVLDDKDFRSLRMAKRNDRQLEFEWRKFDLKKKYDSKN